MLHPLLNEVPRRVGVLDLLAGDLDLQRGLDPPHNKDGDSLDADLDLLRLTPDTLSLLLGLRDCLDIAAELLRLWSSLMASVSCWSKLK